MKDNHNINAKSSNATKPIVSSESDTCFSKYIKKKQKYVVNPKTQKHWSTQDLAAVLSFDYDRFRKIVNMSRPTQKRDVIITICIVLLFSVDETDQALILYNMPVLDASIKRDEVFIQILENKQASSFVPQDDGVIDYVGQIDILLRYHGCSALDLHKQTTFACYTPIKQKVSVISDELFFGPEYETLSAKFQPYNYCCKASLLLENQESKHRLIISVTLSINESTYWIQRDADGRIEKYDFHTDDQDLIPYYKETHHAAMNKLYSLLHVLDDSRNYMIRKGACYKDGRIHFYLESFNYDIPELNEYCLIEKAGKELSLNVYDHSEFIYHHIGADEYNRVFGYREHKPLISFTSLQDLEKMTSCMPKGTERIHYSIWKSIFAKLLAEQEQLQSDLQCHRAHIRCIEELDDSDMNVCEYYKVETACKKSADGLQNPNLTRVGLVGEDLIQTELSVEELRQSYQLGIPDIESIYRVKKDFGTIWDILS